MALQGIHLIVSSRNSTTDTIVRPLPLIQQLRILLISIDQGRHVLIICLTQLIGLRGKQKGVTVLPMLVLRRKVLIALMEIGTLVRTANLYLALRCGALSVLRVAL